MSSEQQLKDLAFELLISANNITSLSEKSEIKRLINLMNFTSTEKQLILNGEWGKTKKILKNAAAKTVATNDYGKALIDHGVTDKKTADDIINYYKNNRFSGLGGKGIEHFNNFLDAYLPRILDEKGKFSETNVKHLKLIQEVNEEHRKESKEAKKTAKDEAYSAWILGNDIRINGKIIHNEKGIKQQIKAINPNADVNTVLQDIIKLGDLQAKYALLTDDGKEKFSVFTYLARENKTKDSDSTEIKKLEKEISDLVKKLGPCANISLFFKNARATAVPTSIKQSKSYKEQLKADASNIISEINGVEKLVAEELFDALMLEGIGKILKIPVASNVSKWISEKAPKVFEVGTKASTKAKDVITKTIDWIKPVDPVLAKTMSLASQAPKTILKTAPHIAGGMVKYDLASDLIHNVTDKIDMSEKVRGVVNSADEALSNLVAFKDPVFAFSKLGLDYADLGFSWNLPEWLKMTGAGLASHNVNLWKNSSLDFIRNSKLAKAFYWTNSNITSGLNWAASAGAFDGISGLPQAVAFTLGPAIQKATDLRLRAGAFNIDAASEGTNNMKLVPKNIILNLKFHRLLSFENPLRDNKNFKIENFENLPETRFKYVLKVFAPEIFNKYGRESISKNNVELINELKERDILKYSEGTKEWSLNFKTSLPYLGIYDFLLKTRDVNPNEGSNFRDFTGMPTLNYSEVLRLAIEHGIDPRFTLKTISHHGEYVDLGKHFEVRQVFGNENPSTIKDKFFEFGRNFFYNLPRVGQKWMDRKGVNVGLIKNKDSAKIEELINVNDRGEYLQLDINTGKPFWSKDFKMNPMTSEFLAVKLPSGSKIWVNTSGHLAIFFIGKDRKLYVLNVDANGPGSGGEGESKNPIKNFLLDTSQFGIPAATTLEFTEVKNAGYITGKHENLKAPIVSYIKSNKEIKIKGFLFPEEYYEKAAKKLLEASEKSRKTRAQKGNLEYIEWSPEIKQKKIEEYKNKLKLLIVNLENIEKEFDKYIKLKQQEGIKNLGQIKESFINEYLITLSISKKGRKSINTVLDLILKNKTKELKGNERSKMLSLNFNEFIELINGSILLGKKTKIDFTPFDSSDTEVFEKALHNLRMFKMLRLNNMKYGKLYNMLFPKKYVDFSFEKFNLNLEN